MFNKREFRPLSRTLVVETQVHEVTANKRNRLLRQSTPVGIPVETAGGSRSAVVNAKGAQIAATQKFLSIETPEPILLQIGSIQFVISGQFALTGTFPQAVLVSDKEVLVNIVQY